jgi:hypothetical protein
MQDGNLSTFKINIAELLITVSGRLTEMADCRCIPRRQLLTALTDFTLHPIPDEEWHAARSEFGPVLAVGLAGMALRAQLQDTLVIASADVTLIGCCSFRTCNDRLRLSTAFLIIVLRLITGMGTGGLFERQRFMAERPCVVVPPR